MTDPDLSLEAIVRYNPPAVDHGPYHWDEGEMEEEDTGKWVRYADYAALAERLVESEVALEGFRNEVFGQYDLRIEIQAKLDAALAREAVAFKAAVHTAAQIFVNHSPNANFTAAHVVHILKQLEFTDTPASREAVK